MKNSSLNSDCSCVRCNATVVGSPHQMTEKEWTYEVLQNAVDNLLTMGLAVPAKLRNAETVAYRQLDEDSRQYVFGIL